MTEISGSTTLSGRDIDGHKIVYEVKGGDRVPTDGALVAQRVRTDDGGFLVRRSLRDATGRALLDNEICALARLNRAFRADRPWPFPRLLAYDMDSADPWALVSDYRGVPAADAVDSFLSAELWEFTTAVFDAVAHLAAVELTHNALGLGVLHVSDAAVQITTFERAALVGEPVAGGEANPLGDLPDAARLVYAAYTGRHHDRPDLAESVAALRGPLAGVFDGSRCPPVDEVLRRLGRTTVPKDTSTGALDNGRAAFEQARRRKLGPEQATIRTQPVPQRPARRDGRRWLFFGVLVLISAVAFGIAQVIG